MILPQAVILIFLFALGISTGSFLNVVVYRLPREMSLVQPGSHCTSCGKPIAWYDNIPVFAWFFLRGRCRHCGAAFSFRYPLVELLTGLLFITLYWGYFSQNLRQPMPEFFDSGWLIYLGHIALLSALLAATLIDAEHWIIPLSLCYIIVGLALFLSLFWPYALDVPANQLWRLVPYAGPKSAALAGGAALGLAISLLLIRLKILKRSFHELIEAEIAAENQQKNHKITNQAQTMQSDSRSSPQNTEKQPANPPPTEPPTDLPEIPENIRREMFREILFLAPILILALGANYLLTSQTSLGSAWEKFLLDQKWASGLLGCVFGFMIGGGVVWVTRILGSLAFGKEAMGLGDVHLMAAVGAMLGWTSPVIAFFMAPFMALGWALARLVIYRSREIPYGPFLSAATFLVMLFHDPIVEYFAVILIPP
ncbi:MAG: prepilin peptidase [Sedimentisphaerales bacterium]|nr:prepilin peptidase [Sedimentisphaerales bacterium]